MVFKRKKKFLMDLGGDFNFFNLYLLFEPTKQGAKYDKFKVT